MQIGLVTASVGVEDILGVGLPSAKAEKVKVWR